MRILDSLRALVASSPAPPTPQSSADDAPDSVGPTTDIRNVIETLREIVDSIPLPDFALPLAAPKSYFPGSSNPK